MHTYSVDSARGVPVGTPTDTRRNESRNSKIIMNVAATILLGVGLAAAAGAIFVPVVLVPVAAITLIVAAILFGKANGPKSSRYGRTHFEAHSPVRPRAAFQPQQAPHASAVVVETRAPTAAAPRVPVGLPGLAVFQQPTATHASAVLVDTREPATTARVPVGVPGYPAHAGNPGHGTGQLARGLPAAPAPQPFYPESPTKGGAAAAIKRNSKKGLNTEGSHSAAVGVQTRSPGSAIGRGTLPQSPVAAAAAAQAPAAPARKLDFSQMPSNGNVGGPRSGK